MFRRATDNWSPCPAKVTADSISLTLCGAPSFKTSACQLNLLCCGLVMPSRGTRLLKYNGKWVRFHLAHSSCKVKSGLVILRHPAAPESKYVCQNLHAEIWLLYTWEKPLDRQTFAFWKLRQWLLNVDDWYCHCMLPWLDASDQIPPKMIGTVGFCWWDTLWTFSCITGSARSLGDSSPVVFW